MTWYPNNVEPLTKVVTVLVSMEDGGMFLEPFFKSEMIQALVTFKSKENFYILSSMIAMNPC